MDTPLLKRCKRLGIKPEIGKKKKSRKVLEAQCKRAEAKWKKEEEEGTRITIPDNVTSILSKQLDHSDQNTYVLIQRESKKLRNITIPNSVTSIGYHVFISSKLKHITIPDSVTSIGAEAFYNCRHLKTVNLSNSLKMIEPGMFKLCLRLTHITIPNSVTSIEEHAFYNCKNL